MKWTREDYIELLTAGNPPREMLAEMFGPLVGLPEEWAEQGATPGQMDLTDFGFDYVSTHYLGGLGPANTFPREILEENDEYILERDHLGRTTKLIKASASIPLPLDYPVKNMDDWMKMKHMYTYIPERTAPNVIEAAIEAHKQGDVIVAWIPGGFAALRDLMGEENTCFAFYDQPDLIFDILNTISDTNYRVLDEITRHVPIDQLSIHEDMAGTHAPLIGPDIVNEFLKPYYLRSWNLVNSRSTRLFSQDSDGNMNPLIDAFIDCGVNIFYPCEPAGGMDIVQLREKYGHKIAFKGGIDKYTLRKDKEAIRQELEYKMQPGMLGGGVCFGLDHRIPNGVSLENYIYYVTTARALLGLPPLEQAEKGWGRMAF